MSPSAESLAVVTEDLRRIAADLLKAVGVPKSNANLVADALVESDIENQPSHGVLLLPMFVERIAAGSVSATGEGRVVSDESTSIVIDAENALGHVTSNRAANLCAERARECGIAGVAVRNGFHFGTASRWARLLAQTHCVGIAMSNTRPLMPAPGGSERVVGNNPISIAVPTGNGDPIVADIALSAGAMMKIRLAAALGTSIPDGWAADKAGAPTNDPKEAIQGMLLPIGGAKGFALAAVIDLIAGGLSSGAIGDDVRPLYGDPRLPYRCSHFFLAIDISRFCPLEVFGAAVGRFADRVRHSRAAGDGNQKPRMPGDRVAAARSAQSHRCHVEKSTLGAVVALAQRHNVSIPASLLR